MNAHQSMDDRFIAETAAIERAQSEEFEAAMSEAIRDDYNLGVEFGIWCAFNAWPTSARAAFVANL